MHWWFRSACKILNNGDQTGEPGLGSLIGYAHNISHHHAYVWVWLTDGLVSWWERSAYCGNDYEPSLEVYKTKIFGLVGDYYNPGSPYRETAYSAAYSWDSDGNEVFIMNGILVGEICSI